MRKAIGFLLVLPVLLWAVAPAALAGGSAISTMAGIIMHLNHYPGSSEKQTLTNIIHDDHATAGEKALAGALMRMQHSVKGHDVDTLRSLASDKQASHDERKLADILLGISHHPSSSDMQRLQSLSEVPAGGRTSHRRGGSGGY